MENVVKKKRLRELSTSQRILHLTRASSHQKDDTDFWDQQKLRGLELGVE